MRNGIYRVWLRGSHEGGASTLLVDGRFIACDRTHTYLGHYDDRNGCFTGEVEVTRHSRPEEGDTRVDNFVMHLTGLCCAESANVRATIPAMPGVTVDAEYVWVSDA